MADPRDVITDVLTARHEELSGQASPRDNDGARQILQALTAAGFSVVRTAGAAPQPGLGKTVQYFLDQRDEYVRVLKQCVNADADYYRWQGHAEARRQLGEKLESAGVDVAAASQARPLPSRDELARAVDPDAFDDAKKRSSHPAAVVQWAARKHMAHQAADAMLTLLNGSPK